MIISALSPFRFAVGGVDVTPAAVNWGDTVPSDYGIADNIATTQTISAIDTTITIKATLSAGGKAAWATNGVLDAYTTGEAWTAVNSGDTLYLSVSAIPSPPTSGNYVSGTVTVTNESDGAAVLDTFTYTAQFVYPPP